MKVLITDKINAKAAEIIEAVAEVDVLPTMSEDELVEKIKDYDALMVRSQTKVTKKIIEAGKNLKIIGRAGVGVDNIDIEAATQNGIIVVNSPDGNTAAAAEHTIALMLSMARNIPQACQSAKNSLWERSKFTGIEVYNKTLGIIGLGKIGSRVAKTALALGMKVIVFDPYTNPEIIEAIGAEPVKTLDEFWGRCDFITVHVPKTKETEYLINKNTINRMKKGVRLVNCARGGIIDEKALEEAINEGQVAGCAIDVFEDEPHIENTPLLNCADKVILTPHLGASTKEAQVNVALDVAEQIKTVLSGGNAAFAVNIPSLKAEILEPVKNYMPLAERTGELVEQLSKGGNLKEVEIVVSGKLSTVNVAPLEIAVLKGIFSAFLEGVNYVNAPVIAKQKGIKVITSKSQQDCDYVGLITVKLTTDKDTNTVSGAFLAENISRFVKINDYNTGIAPAKYMLFVPHENKPSMIAKVATVLGENNINITLMNVVQSPDKETDVSLMVINTSSCVDEATSKKIAQIDGVKNSKFVKLNIGE